MSPYLKSQFQFDLVNRVLKKGLFDVFYSAVCSIIEKKAPYLLIELDLTLSRPFKRDNALAVSWLFRVTCDKPKVSLQPHLRDRACEFRRTCTVSYVNITLLPSSPSTLPPRVWIPSQLHANTTQLIQRFFLPQFISRARQSQLYPGASPGFVKLPASYSTFFSFCCFTAEKEKKTGIAQQTSRTGRPWGRNESHTETLITQTTLQLLSHSSFRFIGFLVSARKYSLFQNGKSVDESSKSPRMKKTANFKLGAGEPINNRAGCQNSIYMSNNQFFHCHGSPCDCF